MLSPAGRLQREVELGARDSLGINLQFAYKHVGLPEQLERAVVEGIFHVVHNFFDARIDDHLGAHQTRSEGGIDGGVFQRYSVIRRLDDRVFLAV